MVVGPRDGEEGAKKVMINRDKSSGLYVPTTKPTRTQVPTDRTGITGLKKI